MSSIPAGPPPRCTRHSREGGHVTLVMVLILLVLGAIVITPLLGFVISGTRQGQQREARTQEFYAADTGVEDAMWRISQGALPDYLLDAWQHDYWNSPEAWTYRYSMDPVNQRGVDVSLRRLWLLQGLEEPHAGTASHRGLTVAGSVTGPGEYQITLTDISLPGNLKIDRIACFLPAGFEYVPGSSNLEQDPSAPFQYRCTPTVGFDAGRNGSVISWDFAAWYPGGLEYSCLPGTEAAKTVTFRFTPGGIPHGAFAWVRTHGRDSALCYSGDVHLYEITATGTDPVTGRHTRVTATAVHQGPGSWGTAISGDYYATGNTLMRDHNRDGYYRERLYLESPAGITDIPRGARVEKVLLYWSGWKNDPWDAWYEDRPFEEWSPASRQALLEQVDAQRLNRVRLQVAVPGYAAHAFSQPVTAQVVQALPNGKWYPGMTGQLEKGWSYSCYADVTDLVREYFSAAGVGYDGNAMYTVGHLPENVADSGTTVYDWKEPHYGEFPHGRTLYPLGSTFGITGGLDEWAYAGWSVVVIYTSPETAGHCLYIYDTLRYCHNDETLVFNIGGFLAPPDVLYDPAAARFTCFVGEGDDSHPGDGVSLNGRRLPDPPDGVNDPNNVWNSRSNVLPLGFNDGIDIDTFVAGNGIIQPGDTEAVVEMGAIGTSTCEDSWNLVYIILSFRSEAASPRLISYIIETGG